MNVSAAISTGANFIADRESFSPVAYWDVNGYAIGYGNHYYDDGSTVDAGDTITEPDAYDLLVFYTEQNLQAIISQLTVPLSANQLAALASLRYNCGTITTALLNLINSGADPAAVANQIKQTCTTSGGVTNPDLINRRILEAALYLQPSFNWLAIAAGVAALFLLTK